MIRNVGTLDRIIRLVIGVLILGLYGALDSPEKYLTLVGLIPVGTAITGNCPLYRIWGFSTVRPAGVEKGRAAVDPRAK